MLQLIDLLKRRLSSKLPGIEAQIKMMPSVRRLNVNFHPANEPIKSAVLVLLYPDKNQEISTVYIKRSLDDGPHSGQISFPGGKMELSDSTLQQTALRESNEEIGIIPEEVEILGNLSELYIPVSNFQILPVVGFSTITPIFKIDSKEVNSIIEVKLKILTDYSICKTGKISVREFSIDAPFYDIDNHKIWGATAMITSEFIEVFKNISW